MSNGAGGSLSAPVESIDISLLGAILGGVVYGVASTLFCVCFYLLLKLLKKDPHKRHYVLVVFIWTVWICCTLIFVSDTVSLWRYIYNKNTNFLVNGVGVIGTVAGFFGMLIVDGLLVWRCLVVLRVHSLKYRALLGSFPVILLLAPIGLGIPYLMGIRLAILLQIELSIDVALNIVVTAIISIHLYLHERWLRAQFPDGQHSPNLGIISMLIESAAIAVVFDLLFLIPFALQTRFQNLPQQLLVYVQALAAYLTIFRVAQGKAWVHDNEVYSDASPSFATAPERKSVNPCNSV